MLPLWIIVNLFLNELFNKVGALLEEFSARRDRIVVKVSLGRVRVGSCRHVIQTFQ